MAGKMQVETVNMIKAGGEYLAPGSIVELDQDEAVSLLEAGVVKEIGEPVEEEEPDEPENESGSESGDDDLSPVEELCNVKGINEELAEALVEKGIDSIAALQKVNKNVLVEIPGIGKVTAERIIEDAKTFDV